MYSFRAVLTRCCSSFKGSTVPVYWLRCAAEQQHVMGSAVAEAGEGRCLLLEAYTNTAALAGAQHLLVLGPNVSKEKYLT